MIYGLIITVVALTIAFKDTKSFIEFCREFGYESDNNQNQIKKTTQDYK